MVIEQLGIEKIIPYKNNAKKHPEKQIKLLAENITRFGFTTPCLVDKDNNLIAGHGRLEAVKMLGWTHVPCVRMENLTPDEVKALRLADKKIAEMSEWDMGLVTDELKELDDDLLDLTGFDRDLVVEPDEKDDDVPDVPVEPRSKLGDLYQLGQHRVLCGDSTKIEYVERLMDGKKADMVFTDPPYNLKTKGGCKGKIGQGLRKQGNSIEFIANFNPADFLDVLPFYFNKNTLNAYIFCNKQLLPNYLVWAQNAGYSFNVLVWKKPNAIPIADSHKPDIEYLLFFRKRAIWNNGLSKTVNYSRLIESKRETGLHPTMKPVDIIINQIKISSHKDSIVADSFLGSGSTLIAAEKTGRICYGMELEPKYIDVIVQRYVDYVDNPVVVLNGKDITHLWTKTDKKPKKEISV